MAAGGRGPCGKGDFTLLLAAALAPPADVVGIDSNADAIAFAEARGGGGLANATFRTATLQRCSPVTAARSVRRRRWRRDGAGRRPLGDLGSHCTRGGLSDVAGVAAASGASCLVCTCCFGKHRALCSAAAWAPPGAALAESEKDVLCRMADSVDPAVSVEARRVISSMRLGRLRDELRAGHALVDARIRTFPTAFSRQTVVLGALSRPCAERRIAD